MARSGPVSVKIELAATIGGNYAELSDCYTVSGGRTSAEKTPTTALGDEVKSQGPTGRRDVEDIIVRGPYDPAAGTAFTMIGRPDTTPGAVPKGLRVHYSDNTSKTYAVLVEYNDPMVEDGKQQEFEAGFYQAGGASTDLVEDFNPAA